jgi:hypothetical protein
VDGLFWSPALPKLAYLLPAILHIINGAPVTPLTMAAIVGVIQWFDQLCRLLFAALDEAYAFASRTPGNVSQPLESSLLAELALVVCLAPAWEADLTREWLPEVIASDASTSFGFGVCVAPLLYPRCVSSVDLPNAQGTMCA